jgi:hypothetical protein
MESQPRKESWLRGREVTRLEALSDAVFGFAATLLVVSLEVPQTFPELVASLRGFVAFAFSFAMLVLIWAAHNSFFRRYGLQDLWTVLINSVLLFVILFYVYPLKFLATALFNVYLGAGQEKPMILHPGEMAKLMIIYAIGFIAVFACFFLLYRHAGSRWRELDLDERERLEARSWSHHYLIFVGMGCLSIVIVLANGPLWVSGVVYSLLGPLCYWNGMVARRRAESLEARLFREDEIPWDELAFRTVRETLMRYFADRREGRFGIHCADIG